MKTALRQSLIALAAALISFPLAAQPTTERDWSETLRTDAQALHDLLAEHHPGQVDVENPGFAQNNAAQLALALERAENADSYGDYYYALRVYAASFNDGHMFFGARGSTPNRYRWPGFAVELDNEGDFRVASTTGEAFVPLGAKLISCDGKSANVYAAETVGVMWGRWALESQRRQQAKNLFFDENSDYIPIADRCVFEHAGRRWDFALNWQPIEWRERWDIVNRSPSPRPTFSARIAAEGLCWFSMPSFDGRPDSPPAINLAKIIEDMNSQREAMSDSSAVVLDLRSNSGGSSDWSYQIARVLWGDAAIAALPDKDHYAEWRVSQDNLDHLRTAFDAWRAGGNMSAEVERYFETAIEGIGTALLDGEQLWREPNYSHTNKDLLDIESSPPPIRVPVYVITDGRCASACLDAMDLWLELGAIHLGLPTSADTNYLEIRRYRLPSGLVGGSIPLKVHRNRARGSNEALLPVERFDGDISDDDALEMWVSQIVNDHAAATSE